MVGEPLQGIAGHAGLGIVNGVEAPLGVVDEEGSSRGRGLHPLVGHHIEDGLVAVVAYACDDGEGEVGNVLGQEQSVEARHVAGGAAASDDDDAVEMKGRVMSEE